MKKYFLLAAAAATVLAVSCNKEKEQPKVDPTPGTEIEDNTPQPIRFGTNIAEVKAPITKAAIENTGWGAGQTLYVYGFRLGTTGAPSITTADAYIANKPAEAPATFANHGVREPINVWEDSANQIPYYYENAVSYTFYGYYIGDATADPATPAISDSDKKVTTGVTINGTQDIMLAATDKFADYIAAGSPTLSLDKVYSEVSARQNVVPDLKFKHQLARFKFETKYGGNGNSDDINIVKIQMKSVKAGTLTIASAEGQGFAATGDWPEHNGEPGVDGKYGFTEGDNGNSFTLMDANGAVATGNPGNGVFAPFGESIMTFPQGLDDNDKSPVYHLLLTLTQAGRMDPQNPTQLKQFTVPMDIDFSKVVDAQQLPIPNKYAEAGKMYVIRLVIYGSEEIKMTVSLEDWEYGGETQVDPDQDTRPVPAITVKDKENSAELTAINDLPIGDANAYNHINATAQYGTTPTDIPSTSILFASSNKKVATVDNTGKVTGVSVGTCTIYVYVNGTDDYQGALKPVTVNVTTGGIAVPDPASTLSGLAATKTIDNTAGNVEWNIPGSNTLKVQVGGADATTQPGTFSYASGNPAIATVNNAGVVTAVANGTVNITISWAAEPGGEYAAGSFVVAVTVENTPLPASTLSGLAATKTIDNTAGDATWDILDGNTLKVQVGGVDVASQPASFSYESSVPAKATVDANGVVTAVADGDTVITISWAAGDTYAAGHFDVTVTVQNTPGVTP